ncbi:sigma-70 family RNA polymerase sigma factor [bacterium]|nr:sigma-70 family RNA polymerase sigma factor [bacterium]
MSALPANLTDVDLLIRFREGDRQCFDELVRRHHGLVYAVAYARLQNCESAEDLAQEVFVRAFLQQEKLRDGSRFAPWVSSMARNLATDWLRRGETRSRLLTMIPMEDEKMAQLPNPGVDQPDEAAEAAEQRSLADHAVRQLPPHQRELVLLHFTEGMSRSDIARHLGVHPSTVGRQLDAAIHAMRVNVETNLKQSAPALRPRSLAPARTMAAIAAVVALPPEAKASVIKAAAESIAHVATEAAPSLTFLEFLQAKLTTLFIGGTAAVGTGKIIVAVTAVALAVAGVHLSYKAPQNNSPMAVLAATPTDKLAGIMEYPVGATTPLQMDYDKIYRLTYPDSDLSGVVATTATFGRDGVLLSATEVKGFGIEEGKLEVPPGKELIELTITPMATLAGCTIFERNNDGMKLTMWMDRKPELAEEMARLTTSYREGRISVNQYREGVVREYKRLNLGPDGDKFRKMYYEKVRTSLPAPMNIPPDLEPLMKGAK